MIPHKDKLPRSWFRLLQITGPLYTSVDAIDIKYMPKRKEAWFFSAMFTVLYRGSA